MKQFGKILRYIFPKYNREAILNFIFILLSVVFGLFSFTMVIPFLGILFENQPLVTSQVPFALSYESLSHNLNYFLSQIIINNPNGKYSALQWVSAFVVIFVLLKTSFLYLGKFYMSPLRNGVVQDVRNVIYHKVLSLHLAFFSDERKGDIMAKLTGDVQEIEVSVIRSLDVLFKDPVTIIVYVVMLIALSPQLTLFSFIILPLAGFLIGRIGKSLRRRSKQAQDKMGSLLSFIEESLSGLRIVKAFNAQKKMDERFKAENSNYTRIMIKMWRRRDLAGPLSEFLATASIVVLMAYGGSLILSKEISLSSQEFIGFLVIFSQIIQPAKNFTNAYYNIQKGMASVDRINEILNAEVQVSDAIDCTELKQFNNKIEYKNVWFKYIDEFVLQDVNIEVKKGESIAIVGHSGSGKSTLVDLLPRFYDLNKGNILIDGTDIRQLSTKSLRKHMGIVNQESILFNDTIFNNIAFGVENASEEEVMAAAKVANAHDFIMETPDGYRTNIGDRGDKLSGGQRQRISIARAILANPPILILDEATSSLDTESERLVQDALNNLMKNRTSIIIAHRLSTIVNADRIYVLSDGCVIESGTHKELINKGGAYKKLHDMQMFS